MRRITFSVAALAFVALAPMASAQNTSKLTFDLRAGMASNQIGDGDEELAKLKSGASFGAGIGYDLTPAFRMGLGLDVAKLPIDEEGAEGDFGLRTIELSGRYSFIAQSRRWTPFVSAHVAQRNVGADVEGFGEIEGSGIGYGIGGGVDYAFSPKMSLSTSAGYTMGKFGSWKLDGEDVDGDDLDGNGFRVNVGVAFRPF